MASHPPSLYLHRDVAFPPCRGNALEGVLDSLTVVSETVDRGFASPPRPLEATTIFVTAKGRATTVVEGTRVPQAPLRLVAVRRGAKLEQLPMEAPWRVRYLMITGPWARRADEALSRRGAAFHVKEKLTAPELRCWDALIRCGLAQHGNWDWELARELAAVLMLLEAVGDESSLPLEQRAARLIDADPSKAWRVEALAEALSLGPRNLELHWKKNLGQTPARWVLERRVRHAKLLLSQGLAVGAVAEACGFQNPYHFSKAFRRVTGKPPSEDRR